MDALEIGTGIVADADAVKDRPIEAGREQDICARKVIAHQVFAAVRESCFNMTQLFTEIFTGLGDDLRRDAIDRAERVRAMAAHHVKTGGIEFRHNEKAPLEPGGIIALPSGISARSPLE